MGNVVIPTNMHKKKSSRRGKIEKEEVIGQPQEMLCTSWYSIYVPSSFKKTVKGISLVRKTVQNRGGGGGGGTKKRKKKKTKR